MGHRPDPIRLRKGVYVSRDIIGGRLTDLNYRYIGDRLQTIAGADGITWDDLRIAASEVLVQGVSNLPDWETWLSGLQLLSFDPTTMEQVFFAVQLPHSYIEGSNIEAHVHWVPLANGGAGEVVSWGLEYSWASIGSSFGSTATIYGNTHVPDGDLLVADQHYYTDIGDIDGTGKGISSMIVCRLFRNATGAGGSIDSYGDDAGLLEIDFHYPKDALGSSSKHTK